MTTARHPARLLWRSRLGWILVLVVAQLAMSFGMPLRAHAAGGVDVCTTAGVKRLPVEPGQAPLHDGDHCPLCRVADTLASPPAIAGVGECPRPRWRIAQAPSPIAVRSVPPHDAPARAPPLL